MVSWAPRALALIPAGAEKQRKLILDALSKKRPEDVLKLASSSQNADERMELILSGLRELAAQSPAKARAWLESCTDPKDRVAAEKAHRVGMVLANPLRVADLAGQTSDREEIYRLWNAATEKARKMDSETFRQLANAPMPSWISSTVLSFFAHRDPVAAADLAAKEPLQQNGQVGWGMGQAFAEWASRDRSLAVEKAQTLTGAQRSAAMAGIASEWGMSEPAAALAWVGSFSTSERQNTRSAPSFWA